VCAAGVITGCVTEGWGNTGTSWNSDGSRRKSCGDNYSTHSRRWSDSAGRDPRSQGCVRATRRRNWRPSSEAAGRRHVTTSAGRTRPEHTARRTTGRRMPGWPALRPCIHSDCRAAKRPPDQCEGPSTLPSRYWCLGQRCPTRMPTICSSTCSTGRAQHDDPSAASRIGGRSASGTTTRSALPTWSGDGRRMNSLPGFSSPHRHGTPAPLYPVGNVADVTYGGVSRRRAEEWTAEAAQIPLPSKPPKIDRGPVGPGRSPG
jgi:hypothetical protein